MSAAAAPPTPAPGPSPSVARTVWRTLRPPFLLLTPCVVLLGLALARRGGPLDAASGWLTLAGAVGAHAAVNALNEWHDHRSGLDARTQRTPFSGGSGALPTHPAAAHAVRRMGLVALVLAMACGLALLVRLAQQGLPGGAALAAIGLAGAAVVVAYTPWATRHPWACLLAPGLGFGPLMVLGTVLAQGRVPDAAAVATSVASGLLAANLLLLNQLPDVDADRWAGRRTLPIVHGPKAAGSTWSLLLAAAWLLIIGLVASGAGPWTLLAGLAPLPFGIGVMRRLQRGGADAATLGPALAWNVVVALATPLLLAWGWVASR